MFIPLFALYFAQFQAAETAVIGIGGHPLAAMFDRDGREPCVRHEITRRLRFREKPPENSGAWPSNVAKGDDLKQRTWLLVIFGCVAIRMTELSTCGEIP